MMTLEDRPAAAISLHAAVSFQVALTVLAESRDDATGVVTTGALVQTVDETARCDGTADGGVDVTADGWHRLSYTNAVSMAFRAKN